MSTDQPAFSRRELLAGGAMVFLFSQMPRSLAQEATSGPHIAGEVELPGSLDTNRLLDAWISIDTHGDITVFTGKAELGQGIKTALRQIAAEELRVAFDAVDLVTADTGRTPDEGYTAGSHSMQDSGTAIRNAAAQVREILVAKAAERLKLEASRLTIRDGAVTRPSGRVSASLDPMEPPCPCSVPCSSGSSSHSSARWPRNS